MNITMNNTMYTKQIHSTSSIPRPSPSLSGTPMQTRPGVTLTSPSGLYQSPMVKQTMLQGIQQGMQQGVQQGVLRGPNGQPMIRTPILRQEMEGTMIHTAQNNGFSVKRAATMISFE